MTLRAYQVGTRIGFVPCSDAKKIKSYRTKQTACINGGLWDIWANCNWNDDSKVCSIMERQQVYMADEVIVEKGGDFICC